MATGVLIPIAISSQFDKSGDERVHAANYIPNDSYAKPAYTKYLTSQLYELVDTEQLNISFAIQDFEYRTTIQNVEIDSEIISTTFTLPNWTLRNQTQTAIVTQNVGVTFSIPAWSFRNVVIPTAVSDTVGVTFSIPAWSFKLHPTASSSQNVGVTFTIQGFTIA